MSNNRKRNDTDRNVVTGMTTKDERTTTETVRIATTPQIMTEGEMTDGTRNVRGTETTNATTEGEIFAEKSIGNRPESTIESRKQIRSLHNQRNGRRNITTR